MKSKPLFGLTKILIVLCITVISGSKGWGQNLSDGLTAGSDATPPCKSGQAQTDVLRISAKINDMSDELYLHFNPAATDGFDGSYDAYKLASLAGNLVPSLYTVDAAGTKYSINTFPFSGADKIVDMVFTIGTDGIVTLSATGIESFNQQPDLEIFLFDTKTGNEISLRTTAEYTFDYYTSDDPKRFKIRFTEYLTGISEKRVASSLCNVYSANKELNIQYQDLQGKKGQAYVYDMQGRKIKTIMLDGSGSQKVKLPAQTGGCIVKLIFSDYTETHKIAIR